MISVNSLSIRNKRVYMYIVNKLGHVGDGRLGVMRAGPMARQLGVGPWAEPWLNQGYCTELGYTGLLPASSRAKNRLI